MRKLTRRRFPLSLGRDARFIVVTGLSGSGKSEAIRALEDLGYFCVDNLPTSLIPTFAELAADSVGRIERAAVVVDVRDRYFLKQFPHIWKRLRRRRKLKPLLIFLEASDGALVRRFSQTRRPHPLAPNRPVVEGILEERARLDAIKRMADRVFDTSDLTVHELRHALMALSRGRSGRTKLVVTLLSFGYKFGVPLESDLVFDVRFLPNPHFVSGLRTLTGRERAVQQYLNRSDATRVFLDKASDLLKFLVPHYVHEGKTYLTIAVGCTGGRHRSVAIAELLRRRVERLGGVRLRIKHRDVAAE